MFLRPAAAVRRARRAGPPVARRRGHVELADRPAAGRLAEPRRRLEDLRRRRHGVRRPARRLRRLAGRPRAPGDRPGGQRAGRPRHALRAADRGRRRRRRGAGPAVRPAAVAVRQLRHRGDDGRGAPDAGRHRPRPRHQGRGLLPRPPRLGRGLDPPRGRRGRPGRPADRRSPATPASRRRSSTWSPSSASTTRRPWSAGARREPRPGRRHDRRAGDDERRHHPARARLPRGGARPAARPRRAAGLRRGQDRPHGLAPAARPAAYGVTPDIICLAKALGGGAAGRPRSAAPPR